MSESPVVVTIHFDPGPAGRYDAGRLLRAYRESAKSLGVTVIVESVPTPPVEKDCPRWRTELRLKQQVWNRIIQSTNIPVILTDSDMLMLKDPRTLFEEGDWDVAVTCREHYPPLNSGVFFSRSTPAAKQFMVDWTRFYAKIEVLSREKPVVFEQYRKFFGAVDQASLGMMLLAFPSPAKVLKLPCSVWNCADREWHLVMPQDVGLLHVKGLLRDRCLGQMEGVAANKKCLRKWHRLWQEADRQARLEYKKR